MKRITVLLLILIVYLYGCGAEGNISKEEMQEETSVAESLVEETTPIADTAQTSTEDEVIPSDETTKPATDMMEDEPLWGTFTPDSTENDYVKEIMQTREFKRGTLTQTYEADYDGNGKKEAFVFCGEYEGDEFAGDLWFVDEQMTATCIGTEIYAAMEQIYYKNAGQIFLLFSHNIGNPMATEIYTVSSGVAVNLAENLPGQKWVDENGYVIVVQEAYDAFYERYNGETEGLWTGHTWKFYPFYFMGGELTEVEAWETTLETVDKMAPLPAEIKEYYADPKEKRQYIYRERTRELIINIAYNSGEDGDVCYNFENVTYKLTEGEPQAWEFVEKNSGFYDLQYSKESFWEVVDSMERVVPAGKEYISEYLSILRKYSVYYPDDFETFLCDLIYVDEDEIPELIIGESGYWISMYTYKDGNLYELMDMWPYGAGGNAGYEYIPYENVIRNYNSDYAGLVLYTSYAKIDENYRLEDNSYYLKMSYEDENGNVIQEYDEKTYDENNWHYYYEDREISKEEYNSFLIQGEFQYIEGAQSYYPFEDLLCYMLDGAS